MNNDVQKLNRSAAELLPGDFSRAKGNEFELSYYPIPDFSDAVLTEIDDNDVVEELEPGNQELLPHIRSIDQNMGVSWLELAGATCLERPNELPEVLQPIVAGEGERVAIQQRISEIRVTCEPLVKCITQRCEPGSAGLYLFCDVDTPLRSGQACLAIARELAIKTESKVLVIDSDLETASLTSRLGMENRSGTREMLRAMNGWQKLVMVSDIDNVSFMPCGSQKLRFTEPSSFVESVLRKALSGISREFAAILVTTGSAFDNSLHAWRGLCTGTFLVLDSESSSRSIAHAAVRELNSAGCRVLGCLPTYRQGKTRSVARRVS